VKVDAPAGAAVAGHRDDLAALDRASRAFEAVLLREVIRVMVAGSTEGGFFGSGSVGETWEELFENGLSDALAGRGELGIGAMVYRQLAPALAPRAEAQEKPRGADPEVTGRAPKEAEP